MKNLIWKHREFAENLEPDDVFSDEQLSDWACRNREMEDDD